MVISPGDEMNDSPLARRLDRVRDLAPPQPGPFGPDHTVVIGFTPDEWAHADPFILLMDDRIDGRFEAGPHPHAGLETVSYIAHGEMGAENPEGGNLREGDVEWTTTGSGVVHGPERPTNGRFRLLQLWITLPTRERWTAPDHQVVRHGEALLQEEPGAEVRLYSGRWGALVSATRNRVPVTFAEIRLAPGAAVNAPVTASHNVFLYVLDGRAVIGGTTLSPGQAGWSQPVSSEAESTLHIGNDGAQPLRLLLYAGPPQRTPLVSYGPFIGESRDDITRSMKAFQAGSFVRV
jgi:quercetin 2,3-dioxygenase